VCFLQGVGFFFESGSDRRSTALDIPEFRSTEGGGREAARCFFSNLPFTVGGNPLIIIIIIMVIIIIIIIIIIIKKYTI